jgi:hypothetical protein
MNRERGKGSKQEGRRCASIALFVSTRRGRSIDSLQPAELTLGGWEGGIRLTRNTRRALKQVMLQMLGLDLRSYRKRFALEVTEELSEKATVSLHDVRTSCEDAEMAVGQRIIGISVGGKGQTRSNSVGDRDRRQKPSLGWILHQ